MGYLPPPPPAATYVRAIPGAVPPAFVVRARSGPASIAAVQSLGVEFRTLQACCVGREVFRVEVDAVPNAPVMQTTGHPWLNSHCDYCGRPDREHGETCYGCGAPK